MAKRRVKDHPDLFGQPLELIAQREVQALNNFPNYGVSEASMAPFLSKIVLDDGSKREDVSNAKALEKALEGMNIFESLDGRYGVSHNILTNQYNGIVNMARLRKGYSGHPTHSGSLVERMNRVPEQDGQKFLSSFKLQYRQPGQKTRVLNYEYFKPNFEPGENTANYTAKKMWIREIVKLMQCIYTVNTVAPRQV